MNWIDEGFLIHKNIYNENSVIAEFYTKNHGKCSGIIFGGTSKKVKNYLQIGNKFHINFNFKKEGTTGYFKVEIDKATTPNYLENKKKLFCIIYTMNLIKTLTVDNETNKNIYQLLSNFFEFLSKDNWLVFFIFWELNFYKTIGYDIDFKNYVTNTIIDGDEKFIVESTKKTIPNFLVNNDTNIKNENDIFSAFKIVGEFLDKSILKPNNISFPSSRIEFGKLIKQI